MIYASNNGKEEQTSGNLGLLDYGARMYESNIGRWMVQDPLAEKYYSQSQYNYCVNNPLTIIDPNDAKEFFSHFEWSKDNPNIGTSNGKIFIMRTFKYKK